uniref:Uncharacterized protein n=1 Tax=Cyanothece sp. (strain PCC 7425 / ATCC 29141) TaxID=395961 RepID=B8HK80_CYAP4
MRAKPIQIVHQIPGRLRFKVPDRLRDLTFSRRLQQLLESIQGVTQVHIDAAAASVVIEFNEQILPTSALLEKLPLVLQTASQPILDSEITNAKFQVAFRLGDNLTTYEREQIEEIYQWRLQEPAFFTTVTAQIFSPIQRLSQAFLSGGLMDQILALCGQSAAEWQSDWQEIQTTAQVKQPADLQQASLELCDRLARKVQNWATTVAGTRGGVLALFQEAGVLAEIPLAIALALKTIHHIGLCYGFTPQARIEQLYGWIILAISTSQTSEEKQAAFSAFYHVQERFERVVFAEMLEETVEEELFGSVREAVLHQAIRYLAEDFSLEDIPLINIVVGITANQTFISEVSETAHHIFQVRWLLVNQKIAIERNLFIAATEQPG